MSPKVAAILHEFDARTVGRAGRLHDEFRHFDPDGLQGWRNSRPTATGVRRRAVYSPSNRLPRRPPEMSMRCGARGGPWPDDGVARAVPKVHEKASSGCSQGCDSSARCRARRRFCQALDPRLQQIRSTAASTPRARSSASEFRPTCSRRCTTAGPMRGAAVSSRRSCAGNDIASARAPRVNAPPCRSRAGSRRCAGRCRAPARCGAAAQARSESPSRSAGSVCPGQVPRRARAGRAAPHACAP